MTASLQFRSLFTQLPLTFSAPESSTDPKQPRTQTLPEFTQRLRSVAGLKEEDVFCNLRVPNCKDDISLVLLTGRGIFCIDVKTWTGKVSVNGSNWQIEVREEETNFTHTRVEQTDDALHAIQQKSRSLCARLQGGGVCVREQLFWPRLLFLSRDVELDPRLVDRVEVVSQPQIQDFLASFAGSVVAWVTDAVTPAWISGRLSYSQLGSVRSLLARVGTWDVLELRSGERLRGDFRGCPFVAVDRGHTGALEFCRGGALTPDTLWTLLGRSPQVTVRMFGRGGARGWLGRSPSATATIPSSSCIVFRVGGDQSDSSIPASDVHSITLSI